MGGAKKVISSTVAVVALAAVLAPGQASAQLGDEVIDIEIPAVVLDKEVARDDDGVIDLAQVVQAAVRGVTTVQEAPAIVTVLTSEEIKDRGYTSLIEVADSVPGWLQSDGFYGQFPFITTRGTTQGLSYMVNSVSMFDPFFNAPSIWRIQGMETVKRIEMITGPGGVLWGANSYLGILNVITKEADDVDGVEGSVTYGDGPGDRGLFRGYVMAGVPDLVGDFDVLLHGSFQTYQGIRKEGPLNYASTASPNPDGPALSGPWLASDQARTFLFTADGTINYGDAKISFSYPVADRTAAMNFNGSPTRENRPSDSREECDPAVFDPSGVGLPIPAGCEDPYRLTRDHQLNWLDRYIMGEWRTRNDAGNAGASVRSYFTQFKRDFKALSLTSPMIGGPQNPITMEDIDPGGQAISFDSTNYRAGGNIDGDVELPQNLRLLYGLEAFHDWFTDTAAAAGSAQGEGVAALFRAPDPSVIGGTGSRACPARPKTTWNPNDPFDAAGQGTATPDDDTLDYIENCPLTHAYLKNRTTLGVYLNPQWKPFRKLTVDGGARLQVAPDWFSNNALDYPLQTTFSGALVYNFAKNWFLKANYAEGFRAPVFNNASNGEAIQFAGQDLDTESSRSIQGEVNARLFRGQRRIREFNFRADYSYSRLEDLIQVIDGQYSNTPPRGIHAGEFLGKLYVEGGHRIELSYSYVKVNQEDRGVLLSMPEHWFNISGVFNVIDGVLAAATRMRVVGAFEDFNEIVEYRDLALNEDGLTVNTNNPGAMPGCTFVNKGSCLQINPHELVRDRTAPAATLVLGLTYTGIPKLELSAWSYNTFNGRFYQSDLFNNFAGGDTISNSAQDFSFQLNATYKY